ncbi:putative nucleic-acid-binding protein [Sphingobium wenxiniae]|jgi:predicted nucleic-acid-binding protein|uniref:type II toxin-antitoxin system VapC family toxin n=1 Tax=Sphingobium wenxiniae (strain DSM 21828 / CGMCC 1.7748 / JZ-1) TaxID=595605 RepID=UPI001622D312|nr:type II toxin-antitoxin system VapC family toxin [Sphingobium wenxiniae]MBB6193642.1 putative nucleic-acid-binding protein [Sphingobium wenxiniae]MBE5074926.1 type II toxin-antitoxin system VapC family toxin [Erythrobacteraceae bacterium E2-1 Yellow Sea]
MKVTADTNILVRGVVRDDAKQAAAVDRLLRQATLIAVSLPCLCEFVWVLRRTYGLTNEDCAAAIRALVDTGNVVTNRPAVDAGLAVLDTGGDFADGVMAHEGKWLGGEVFVSFDRKAVKRLTDQGEAAKLLGNP